MKRPSRQLSPNRVGMFSRYELTRWTEQTASKITAGPLVHPPRFQLSTKG
jgi:hypothetical protein